MLKKIIKLAYYLLFPFFGLYLHNSERVQVIITHNQELLLQKSLVGPQHWGFPGGGVDRNEDPLDAAVREVYEEVGLRLSPDQLKLVAVDRLPHTRRWPRYAVRFYHIELSKKQQPTIIRPYEVIAAAWFPLHALPDGISDSVNIGLRSVI